MRLPLIASAVVLLVAVLGYVAWRQSSTPAAPPAGSPDTSSGMLGGQGGPVVGMGGGPAQDPGMTWQTPGRWTVEPASGMRLATYGVPAPGAGGEAGKCAVYYFGPGQGGGTEANIERWIGEFENPGKPGRRNFEVKGLKVAQVEVAGTYLAHAGMAEAPPGGASGWTLLGAIVEGPQGAVFFKLTGPTATIAPAKKEFEGMLGSMRKK